MSPVPLAAHPSLVALVATMALAGAAGCGKGAGDAIAGGKAPPALTVTPVAWTSADGGPGAVHAVAELDEQVYVFGETGAHVYAGGVPLTSDDTVTAWTAAATMPAADGNGTWAVGLDAAGKLWRVRGTGALEPISARYGLDGTPIVGVAALGGPYAAFGLGTSLAVTDGATVTRYDAAAGALAGGAGLVAWAEGDRVRRFDPAKGLVESWRLPGARLVALSTAGRLAAATERELYYESGTLNLNLVYTAARGATLTGLSAAGGRFWFTAGGRLGMLERGRVERTPDAPLPADARVTGSPSGDVWAVAGGELRRFANAGASDFAVWQQTVMPVFARVCSSCHLPTGTAGVDLASYERWKQKRALIHERVVEHRPSPMPPDGSGVTLSQADLDAIKAWTESAP